MKSKFEKRFLFITNYPIDSNASAAIRNRALIEGLIKCGYKAYTLTREPSKKINENNIEQYYFKNTSLAYSVARSVKNNKNSLLWKSRVFVAKLISSLGKYDNQRILLKSLEKIDLNVSSFDFVISSSDSKVSHLIAERLIKSGRIKADWWIQYWGDPFYSDINKTSILPKIFIRKEEERLLREADFILYTSPFTTEEQKRLYKNERGKMFFIPTPYVKERIYKPVNNRKTTIGYYGSYYKSDRDILPLYKAAQRMESVEFQFIGSSDINLDGKSNISIIERVSYEEILEYEAKCDILVCLANIKGTSQIPGKMYHYAATNKPILLIYEKGEEEIADFFKQYNRYYTCKNEEQDIMLELEKIIKNPDIEPSPIPEFECKLVAKEVLNIIGM
jgi:hypothetical protein